MSAVTPTATPSASLAQLWDRVVDRAEQLKLRSGDQLPSVRELADHLGVTPNSIRDALLLAQAKGIVRVVSRVGAFLEAEPSACKITVGETVSGVESALRLSLGREPVNVLHVLDARRVIEVELIGRAAVRRHLDDLLPARKLLDAMLNQPADVSRREYIDLDFRFHAALVRLSGNEVLAAMQRTLTDLLAQHFGDIPTQPEQRTAAEQFHVNIYAAVVAGDEAEARHQMYEHLSNVYQYLLGFVQQTPRL